MFELKYEVDRMCITPTLPLSSPPKRRSGFIQRDHFLSTQSFLEARLYYTEGFEISLSFRLLSCGSPGAAFRISSMGVAWCCRC